MLVWKGVFPDLVGSDENPQRVAEIEAELNIVNTDTGLSIVSVGRIDDYGIRKFVVARQPPVVLTGYCMTHSDLVDSAGGAPGELHVNGGGQIVFGDQKETIGELFTDSRSREFYQFATKRAFTKMIQPYMEKFGIIFSGYSAQYGVFLPEQVVSAMEDVTDNKGNDIGFGVCYAWHEPMKQKFRTPRGGVIGEGFYFRTPDGEEIVYGILDKGGRFQTREP